MARSAWARRSDHGRKAVCSSSTTRSFTSRAWNYATSTRAVLLFDFLRPGRTMEELDEVPPEVAAALHRATEGTG